MLDLLHLESLRRAEGCSAAAHWQDGSAERVHYQLDGPWPFIMPGRRLLQAQQHNFTTPTGQHPDWSCSTASRRNTKGREAFFGATADAFEKAIVRGNIIR